MAQAEHYDCRFIPPLHETEQLDFQARSARIFQQAMVDGMDVLGAMTIVLVKMGEQFERGGNRERQRSLRMLHPRLLARVGRAIIRARKEGRRHLLPRDLWQPKGIIAGGADTPLYRDKIKEYWGVYPYETYGCTEAGLIAVQAWDRRDLTFIPTSAFYEFIPVEAWAAERLNGTPPSQAVLMDEVQVGHRYEVVISNFYGGAFLRYRMHDLVEVTALRNEELGIQLPQFRFAGRSGDFIDLSGFAGLIDERQLAVAMVDAGIQAVDWVVSKEMLPSEPLLHLYVEMASPDGVSAEDIRARLNARLEQGNSDYADAERMLGFSPLRVTILKPGTFNRYMKRQLERGADLAHLKPARIQPPASTLAALLNEDP